MLEMGQSRGGDETEGGSKSTYGGFVNLEAIGWFGIEAQRLNLREMRRVV